jgi:signal transduction histidine kinase/putative methionine-R-sulfoxide reductase with GAF domain
MSDQHRVTTAVGARSQVAASVLDVHAESLQVAESVDRVVDIARQAVATQAGVGVGAVFLVDKRNEPKVAARIRGPLSADLAAPEIELAGMARRAIREGETVKQSDVSAGLLWAVPMKSARGIEGVVSAVGDLGDLPRFFAHVGLAIARERAREGQERVQGEAETRATNLERAVGILDQIARDGGTDAVLRLIAAAASGVPGIGSTSIWSLRVDDDLYVEVARADGGAPANGSDNGPPADVRRAGALRDWADRLPRWNGCAWVPAGTIERPQPGAGDALIVPLEGSEGLLPMGFMLAEVEESGLSEPRVDDLHRWASLARLALESRSDENRSQRSLEELREEKEQLSELHRMKSQFIAAVSHELRTPLTSITAYAETLRARNITIEETVKDKFLRVIHDESRRLTRIVDDILDLATMDAGRVRLSCRTVDMRAVVEDALDVIRPIADERNVSVTCPMLESVEVQADPDLLKQLVVNLLDNAVKFSNDDGTVVLEVEHDANAVRLAVQDSGPGIPADKLDAIFERFFQVDGTNARRHGGSGLGLAICKSIVAWHDGRIWAESEDGKGARFVVSLPTIRATSRLRAETPVLKDQQAEDTRIPELLIEMVSEVMCARQVSLMLRDDSRDELFIQAAMGLPDDAIRDVRVALGDRIAGRVAKSGETIFIPDLDDDDRFAPSDSARYETRSLVSAPVRVRDETIGVINVTNKTSGRAFDEHDRRLLEMLAQRIALILTKLRDYGSSRDNIDRMESAIRGVIDVRRHYYSNGEEYSKLILDVCRTLGIDGEAAARIHYASILRDVGMTLLPEGVYKKPAKLSEQDRERVQRHPEEGARVLRSIEFLPDVFDIILAHHEEPDGSGYPRGLKGSGIPTGAKILAVVDAYHSMRSGRPYRDPVSEREAIEELQGAVGQFDERVVHALVEVLKKRLQGVSGSDQPSGSQEDGHTKHEGMA